MLTSNTLLSILPRLHCNQPCLFTLPNNISSFSQFSWPPFVMGSAFLVVLLTMKHLVRFYFFIYHRNFPYIMFHYCCFMFVTLTLQGKSNKRLRFLRASGPLTAVVLGTIFVKIFHPPAIPVVR